MRRSAIAIAIAGLALSIAAPTWGQQLPPGVTQQGSDGEGQVQLDFADVELSVVIDTIARLTGTNFIYDDRVRGRVTIVSPSAISVDAAYAVFESVLQVKGFTTVKGPGGITKIIPVRDAKESSIETVRGGPSPNRDQFVTRLIPLQYIDAEAITNTVKPLVSKDAAMVAYAPTNTIILTDTSANIRRLLSILAAIDVETYKEEMAVIKIHHADAGTLGSQISEIYGGQVAGDASSSAAARRRTARTSRGRTPDPATAEAAERGKIRIITDGRTNSLLVLASRSQLEDIRELIRKLDVPVTGGGRVHVYYLRNADAEELVQTLNTLLSGAGPAASPGRTGGSPGGAAVQALRSAITELAEGVTLSADPGTNSLVIQASKEAYETLREVIEKLDISRPQVLVEALIMEVLVSDSTQLGFNAAAQLANGWDIGLATITDAATAGAIAAAGADVGPGVIVPDSGGTLPFIANAFRRTPDGTTIQGILRASASDGDTNIISAPHILTSDNEEAEIRIGDNIPIITSRVQSGVTESLSTSVNVERQDIGVTLRVTPQISEGETLRLRIFQEITSVNETLTAQTGNPADVGVALSNRRVENTVVVQDGATVVIGGLISDEFDDNTVKIPWLGDIPVLGWAFKTRSRSLTKKNLLVFLTPHIVRNAEHLEAETIRKREEFRESVDQVIQMGHMEEDEKDPYNPLFRTLRDHESRYPLERMREIEIARAESKARKAELLESDSRERTFAVRIGVFTDEKEASSRLTDLYDGGYDGTLISSEADGVITFEIELGPYQTLEEAERNSTLLREGYGYDTSVTVTTPE